MVGFTRRCNRRYEVVVGSILSSVLRIKHQAAGRIRGQPLHPGLGWSVIAGLSVSGDSGPVFPRARLWPKLLSPGRAAGFANPPTSIDEEIPAEVRSQRVIPG